MSDMKPFQELLNLKVYEWSLEKAHEEARSGFKLLQRVRSRSATSLLLCLQHSPEAELFQVVEAMVNVAHQEVLQSRGDAVSQEVRALFCDFKIKAQKLEKVVSSQSDFRFSKVELGKIIASSLEKTLGCNAEQVDFFSWVYRNQINNFLIETKVTLNQHPQLECSHSVFLIEQNTKNRLLQHTDILQLLGLGAAKWDLITGSNLNQTVQDLGCLCENFLKFIQEVLSEIPRNFTLSNYQSDSSLSWLNPEFQNLNQVFDLRYFNWARSIAQCELLSNFSTLRKIKGTSALQSISAIDSLNENEKNDLVRTLTKRVVKYDSFKLTGETWTDENQFILENFNLYLQNNSGTELDCRVQKFLAGECRINKAKLRSLIKRELKTNLGQAYTVKNMPEIMFKTPINSDWYIHTLVDIGGNYQIRYEHHVCNDTYRISIGSSRISFMQWLGLGDTTWDLLTEDETSEAVSLLRDLCLQFVTAAPDLLKDLSSVSQWIDLA